MNLKKNPRSDSKATALKAGEVKDEGKCPSLFDTARVFTQTP